MSPEMPSEPSPDKLLRTFAELAKSTSPEVPRDVLGSSQDFVTQPLSFSVRGLFKPGSLGQTVDVDDHHGLGSLIKKDALHSHERILRLGWLWFAGTVIEDGERAQYLFPAVSVPVRHKFGLLTTGEHGQIEVIGDVEMTPLITDGALRDRLAADVKQGGGALAPSVIVGPKVGNRILDRLPELRSWSNSVSSAVGIKVDEHVISHMHAPPWRRSKDGIVAFYNFALYIDRRSVVFDRSASFNELAALPGLKNTALSKLYWPSMQRPASTERSKSAGNTKVRPLSAHQVGVLKQVRAAPVAAVTGAPGTGKSHVLTSLAMDAVSRGKSVLVVGSSPHAVDVLVEHFQRTPGAVPVAFGGSVHGNRLADELLELRSKAHAIGVRVGTSDAYEELQATITDLVSAEDDAARFLVDSTSRIQITEALERAGDLEELEAQLVAASKGGVYGLLGRRHRTEVARRLGLGDFEPAEAAATLARLQRSDRARRLALVDGLSLETTFENLLGLEPQHFELNGRRIVGRRQTTQSASDDHIVGQVAMALRSGRAARRRTLAQIHSQNLVRAVPLWIGVAHDVDDVLPVAAGMFDVAIIDEAAQLDQMAAAHALVRAKELIVCGDSQQLGFVSFLSDDQVRVAEKATGIELHLDPRRQSVLDLASTAGPTYQLTEHFRSAPHLIEFSSRRFYGSQVQVVTRRPDNESADHIAVHVVADGARTGAKSKQTNPGEVDAVMRILAGAIDQGWRSIGVLSPFRAQADALEAAIIKAYRPEEITKYGLRSGTVHGFQGDERDLLIVSWAIGEPEGTGAWRFVNQRDLFNVMVTRARKQIVVVTSVAEPPGLAGEYVQWSEPLENLVDDVGSTNRWVNRVADACRDAGIETRVGYPVGSHVVDLVLGPAQKSVAVDCVPHEDGAEAHLDRALMLRRGGWQTADAFQSRWHEQLGELALDLARRVDDAAV